MLPGNVMWIVFDSQLPYNAKGNLITESETRIDYLSEARQTSLQLWDSFKKQNRRRLTSNFEREFEKDPLWRVSPLEQPNEPFSCGPRCWELIHHLISNILPDTKKRGDPVKLMLEQITRVQKAVLRSHEGLYGKPDLLKYLG